MNEFDVTWTEFEPVASERARDGEPTTRLAESARTERFSTGLWEVTPGRFSTAPTGYDEVVHILSGRGVLRSSDGEEITLHSGVKFVMYEGFTGEWEIHELLQKLYVQVHTT